MKLCKPWLGLGLVPVTIIELAPPWSGMSPEDKYRWRYRNEPEFAIKERLRRQAKKHAIWGDIQTRVRDAMNRKRPRGGAVFEFLGYTPFDLKGHLERQFKPGMTWDAFRSGKIHIDHVLPVALFDLSIDDEIRRCWGLPNLRPEWAEKNIEKSARRVFLI